MPSKMNDLWYNIKERKKIGSLLRPQKWNIFYVKASEVRNAFQISIIFRLSCTRNTNGNLFNLIFSMFYLYI